jgi:hypothetical protein
VQNVAACWRVPRGCPEAGANARHVRYKDGGWQADGDAMLKRAFEALARLLFILVTLALFVLALALVVSGAWQLVSGALQGEAGIHGLMNGVGLLIVALAIGDVAKFVFEENVVRERELAAPAEALRALTKFMTIIIIALSLESLVGIFEAGRDKSYDQMAFPTLVMVSAVLALVGLGGFQFLSRRSRREVAIDADDGDAEETAPPRRDPG